MTCLNFNYIDFDYIKILTNFTYKETDTNRHYLSGSLANIQTDSRFLSPIYHQTTLRKIYSIFAINLSSALRRSCLVFVANLSSECST